MNLIFVSTTLGNLQNLPRLKFLKSFKDDESSASFYYSIIEYNYECKTVFIVSSDLTSFFQNRADVFEDDRFNALSSFIEDKIRKEICPNTNNKLEKSYYAFHSHYDIFDDETFHGKSFSLSDDSHIVWGFSHQGTDEIYTSISYEADLSEIANKLINVMEGNAQ